MQIQDKQKLLNIIQNLINDNLGQKITKWNGTALFGTLDRELTALCQGPMVGKNDAIMEKNSTS